MKIFAPKNNMSVLYLALACLLYYLLALGFVSPSTPILHSEGTQYIEIEQDGYSTIYSIDNTSAINDISDIYNIDLRNGDKIIVGPDESVKMGRISGAKSISLGVPIGINSALVQDLVALPGIGSTLAGRIIAYRESTGGFDSLDELDNVPGIGKKRVESLKGKASLD